MMDEVAYFMDWDLEAVVRGCCSSTEAAPMEGDPFILDAFVSHNNNNNNNNLNVFSEVDMFESSFPEFSESTRVVLDELGELYKPFYPSIISSSLLHSTPPPPHHHHEAAIVTANPQPTTIIPKEQEQDNVSKVKPSPSSQKVVVAPPQHLQQLIPSSVVSKSKRSKKNMNKRVVKKVGAGEIGGCDAWAWRKYGQKPIKGSPYPRSYYRCSSSKGCLARKQVERSHVDPAVFLVTYTADHIHPHPTRRNSLAGSTRLKPNHNNNNINTSSSSSSNSASFNSSSLSPRTPLVVQSMQHNNNNIDDETTITTVTTTSSSSNIVVELLDGGAAAAAAADWFPKTQKKNTNNNIIDEEMMMMGLDYRLLQIEIQQQDACHFMDHDFAAAATY